MLEVLTIPHHVLESNIFFFFFASNTFLYARSFDWHFWRATKFFFSKKFVSLIS